MSLSIYLSIYLSVYHPHIHERVRALRWRANRGAERAVVGRADLLPWRPLRMPFDPNGNAIEQCGDKCLSVRFANDSGRAAAIDGPAPVLCGFGCGAYGEPARGGMCASCIHSKGFEKDFPAAAAAPSGEASTGAPVKPGHERK